MNCVYHQIDQFVDKTKTFGSTKWLPYLFFSAFYALYTNKRKYIVVVPNPLVFNRYYFLHNTYIVQFTIYFFLFYNYGEIITNTQT